TMPEMSGLEAAPLIRRESPKSQILIISQNDPTVMQDFSNQVGAKGFIPKASVSQQLFTKVDDLIENGNRRKPPPKQNDAANEADVGSGPSRHDELQERSLGDGLSELAKTEFGLRGIIDVLPVAIYATDAEGHVTYFSPAAVTFSGRVPELGTAGWCVSGKLFYPEGRPMPHDACPMAIALKESRILDGVEAIAERPDGGRVWFKPYPRLLRDSKG